MPRLPVLVILALLPLGSGCSEPSGPGRYAVVERGLAWEASGSAPAAPAFSLAWDFGSDSPVGFSDGLGRPAELVDGALVARGLERVALRTPSAFGLDPDLHHRLVWEAQVTAATHVRVRWRAAGQSFDESRSTAALALAQDGAFALPLSDLRGIRHEADASEGVEQLELLFEGPAGSQPEVRLTRLAFVSDFDRGGDARDLRLERLGIARRGTAVPVPGKRTASLEPGPRDRLRLGLAPAGASGDLTVRLSLEGADAPLAERRLAPGDGWLDLALDLSPADGEACQLVLEVEGSGGVLLVGSALRLAPSEAPRPDVVLYLEDTLRRDRLSVYGHPYETDPALARLAGEGVVFERAYGASSWTRPSVATLLTALDPPTHGVTVHTARLSPQATTLAQVLADEGWLTVSLVTNYHGGAWAGLDGGYDVAAEPTAWGASRLPSTLTSAALAAPLAALLEEHHDEALFVAVHTLDPHEPYEPPGDLLYPLAITASERPPTPGGRARADESLAYDAEVRHNDDRLGELEAALTASGSADDTLLVFVSDHGEAFGEHGAFRHRNSLLDEELAVPLVLHWPAGLTGGARLDTPVGLVDVAPTVLGLLGLDAPARWQGRDLAPVLRGERPPPRDEPVLAHLVDAEGLESLAVVGRTHKLLARPGSGRELVPTALYDLEADPGEQQDLLGTPEGDEAAMALVRWAEGRLAEGRERALDTSAAPMDEATRQWMMKMGYLGG
jgi:arylsulfatase A-like enzyme